MLAALATGIPVIAAPGCGLGPRPGVTFVVPMNAPTLRVPLLAALGDRG